MSRTPSRAVLGLYRWTTRLGPAQHRGIYAEEQVLLFAQVWAEECPRGGLAQCRWAAVLLMRSIWAAIGAHLDRRRRAHGPEAGGRFASGGGAPLGRDVRFTLRSLRASSWYATAVVGVVAVTMTLATTTLAIVDGVLFKPLPYPAADRLVEILPGFHEEVRQSSTVDGMNRMYGVSEPDLRNWQAAVPDVPMTGFRAQPWGGLGRGVNDSAAGVASIQQNFFDVIGVAPLFGGFASQDFVDTPSVKPVLILYDIWQSRFGGATDVVGREIITDRAGGYGVRVVGVMPQGFVFPSTFADVEFITPLVSLPDSRNNPRARALVGVIGRLSTGITPAVFADRLKAGLDATAAEFPALGPKPAAWSDAGWRRQGPYEVVEVVPLSDALARRAGPMFRAVLAAVLLLVTIAGANVSSLMTARALERHAEMSLRRSLGAGSGAITRLWIVEAATLLGVGGLLGVAVAPVLVDLITRLLPSTVVLMKPAQVDWRVAGFVAGALVLMAVVVAIAPIRRSMTRQMTGATSAGRTASERVRTPGRLAVIGAQVAIAFVLTVLGSSLVGSLLAVYANDRPIRTQGVVAVNVRFQGPGATMDLSPDRTVRERVLREELMRIPGVSLVASSAAQVLVGGGAMSWFTAPPGTTNPSNLGTWPVTEGFYDALEPQLVMGRLPTNDELRSGAPLIVVSERTARAYWPAVSAVGQALTDQRTQATFTVGGGVKVVRWQPGDTESPVIYPRDSLVCGAPWVTMFLRTDSNSGRVIADALRVIEQRDPMTTVNAASTLDELYRDTVSLRCFQSWLFGGFAAAALVVVGVGILGLLAMSAARRTKEVGIRCALGATPRMVTTLMVREQLRAVTAGLVVGALAAAWAVGFVEGYLYQLTTTDPRIWITATALILAMAAVGTLIPAIRASRVDPLQALRTE